MVKFSRATEFLHGSMGSAKLQVRKSKIHTLLTWRWLLYRFFFCGTLYHVQCESSILFWFFIKCPARLSIYSTTYYPHEIRLQRSREWRILVYQIYVFSFVVPLSYRRRILTLKILMQSTAAASFPVTFRIMSAWSRIEAAWGYVYSSSLWDSAFFVFCYLFRFVPLVVFTKPNSFCGRTFIGVSRLPTAIFLVV